MTMARRRASAGWWPIEAQIAVIPTATAVIVADRLADERIEEMIHRDENRLGMAGGPDRDDRGGQARREQQHRGRHAQVIFEHDVGDQCDGNYEAEIKDE